MANTHAVRIVVRRRGSEEVVTLPRGSDVTYRRCGPYVSLDIRQSRPKHRDWVQIASLLVQLAMLALTLYGVTK